MLKHFSSVPDFEGTGHGTCFCLTCHGILMEPGIFLMPGVPRKPKTTRKLSDVPEDPQYSLQQLMCFSRLSIEGKERSGMCIQYSGAYLVSVLSDSECLQDPAYPRNMGPLITRVGWLGAVPENLQHCRQTSEREEITIF